jgi:hypothetical protein
MSHLRLVPPLPQTLVETRPADTAETPRATAPGTSWMQAVPAPRTSPEDEPMPATPYDDPNVALMFFQAASGVCLCRSCTKQRHPAYGAR